MDVNVKGLVNTLEAIRLCNVKKIIYASSIAAFGNQESGTVDEKTSYQGYGVAPVSALYGIAKLMGEQLCALYSQNHGIEWISLRLSSVYGERQHLRGVNVIPMVEVHHKVRQNLTLDFAYNPKEVHDYIYVGDVARANLIAMEMDVTGEIITIATGVPTSLELLINTVLKACGSKNKPKFISDQNRLKSAGATINSFNIEKAKLLLNWKPEISLQDGVKKLVEWLDRRI
jgi:UDP-glucose 4-epimerase